MRPNYVQDEPLAGLVVCVSGMDDPSLSHRVTELGGTFSSELTRDVTHLICVKAGSAKHRRACDWIAEGNDMLIVRPQWLIEVETVGAVPPEYDFEMPPLSGLEICTTGFGPGARSGIHKLCRKTGAHYTKSLTPDCTHLICAGPGSMKFQFANSTDSIRVVHKEWLVQCERRRRLINEVEYLVVLEQSLPPSGKEGGIAGGEPRDEPDGLNKQRPKPSGDDDEEIEAEPLRARSAPLDREQAQDDPPEQEAEEDLVVVEPSEGPRPTPYPNALPAGEATKHDPTLFCEATTFFLAPSILRHKKENEAAAAKARQIITTAGGSVSDALTSLVNYIVIVQAPVSQKRVAEIEDAQKIGPFIVSLAWLEKCRQEQQLLEEEELAKDEWAFEDRIEKDAELISQPLPTGEVMSNVFEGLRCALGTLVLYDSQMVKKYSRKLTRGRAKVLPVDERGIVISGVATHIVCGMSLPAGSKHLIDHACAQNKHAQIVTTMWIDSCLNEGALLHPTECILFRPVQHETPLPGMERANITVSGHQTIRDPILDRRRDVLGRLVRLLGANYNERMKKAKTTHLIADGRPSAKSDKVEKAKEWGIKIVSYKWLFACAEHGFLVDAGDFPYEELPEDDEPEELAEDKDEAADMDLDEEDEITPAKARVAGGMVTPTRNRRGRRSPRTKRRSPRLQQMDDEPERALEQAEVEPENSNEDKIRMFKRFTDGLQLTQMGVARDEAVPTTRARRRSARSASASLDANELADGREWSLDASQSQVIQHRDLTPPPTPTPRKRSMPHRAAKRGRSK